MRRIFVLIMVTTLILTCGCNIFGEPVILPYGDSYYESFENIEELVAEFKSLGFSNIETIPCDYSGYQIKKIKSISIDGGWFGFDAGDKYYSEDLIEIEYYAQCLNLTIENCPDLKKILTDNTSSYMDFLEKYDGCYIEFDGCVQTSYSYMGGTSHIIEVTGGDYNCNGYDGLKIRVDVDLYVSEGEASINENVIEGSNVKVIGKVGEYRGEFFKLVYIKAVYLQYR